MLQHKKYTYEEVKEISEKYDTLTEFTKNHVGAYEAALNNGWLSSFTHLKRRRLHTIESILKECNKFSNYHDFRKSDASIYGAFLNFYNNGIITDKDLSWVVTKRKKHWTYEDCYNEAKKYDSRWNFKKGNNSAYNRAIKENWLDDYIWFTKVESKYTYEICKELASKYKSRAEFQINDSGAYSQAARNGWLDNFHFEESKIKWNKEIILEECNKYKTKTNLFNNNKHAYDAYQRFKKKGLITDDEINWERSIRTQGDENERIHSVYVYDFGNKVAYVGRTNNPHQRDLRHRRPHHSHGKDTIQSVLRYSIDSGIPIPDMKMLEMDLNMQESCRLEDYWLNEYKKNGYTMLNKGVTGEFVGSIGGFKSKWTREKVIEYAKQFDSYTDLCKDNQYMPKLLRKFNLLDELFPNRLRAHKVTFEEAKEAASKYKTRTMFQKGDWHHYYAAWKNGWLDLLFPNI